MTDDGASEPGEQAETPYPVHGRNSVDVVLWGATGFAGRRVAKYLTESDVAAELEWALAGRDEQRLHALRGELAERDERFAEMRILTGDALNRPSLSDLAREARVICSTVGPYGRYGTPLVEACVAHGTDYCDLTGEVHWVRRMVDEFHDEARDRGARIVHACGFDSVPSDLGTLMLQDHAIEQFGEPCDRIKLYVERLRGGLSGGTIASVVDTVGEVSRNREMRRVVGHPYALNPPGERSGPDGSLQSRPVWDEDVEAWTAPFVMASINEKIVRRTNALLGYRYGRGFQYSESMETSRGMEGVLSATGISAGLGAFAGALAFRPTRALLEAFFLPDSGEGPSDETIEGGEFRMRLIGKRESGGGPIRAVVGADSDPGYGATAAMVAECARCLAIGETNEEVEGGILTPASAIGMALVERLRTAGMTFRVE